MSYAILITIILSIIGISMIPKEHKHQPHKHPYNESIEKAIRRHHVKHH